MASLLLATSLSFTTAAKSSLAQSSGPSNRDKAKACNDLADKKGLQGNDRKSFMQDCLNKAANPGANVTQQDKANVCKNLADKKGLKGADRRSYLKDCMNKANPQ
jgi:hypothetical protein